MRRWLMIVLLTGMLTACALHTPLQQTAPSVRVWTTLEGGTCSTWAVADYRWVTAKHCTLAGDFGSIDGMPSAVVARSATHDIALVSGPKGRALHVADTQPQLGTPVTIYGFGLGRDTLLAIPGTLVAHATDFFNTGHPEMIVTNANGMPGMSGGPMLVGGRVVSLVSGGGAPGTHGQRVGSGVPWSALRAFVAEQRGR